MNNTLTLLQAYNAMIYFLGDYYDKTLSDDLGSLLGDIQLLSDNNGTWDPAAWHDWTKGVATDQPITMKQAFKAMRSFLEAYYRRTSYASCDIKELIDQM